MAEVQIYDVGIDDFRPVTQDDIREYDIIREAIGLQPEEIRNKITATIRELRARKGTPK